MSCVGFFSHMFYINGSMDGGTRPGGIGSGGYVLKENIELGMLVTLTYGIKLRNYYSDFTVYDFTQI